jgi:hypothetical protein
MSLYDDIDGVPLKENNSSETGLILVLLLISRVFLFNCCVVTVQYMYCIQKNSDVINKMRVFFRVFGQKNSRS